VQGTSNLERKVKRSREPCKGEQEKVLVPRDAHLALSSKAT
jgi:hypothetical protein